MDKFSEVEWKKLNATTQELVCTVVRNQFCVVLTETWISASYGVRFGSTTSQHICDDQMLQRILSKGTFGELF